MRRHEHEHGHSHGSIDPSIRRSKAGLRAVSLSLAVLLVTAVAQVGVFLSTSSVALLADLIHNVGDASTAVPLGVAFVLRSARAERVAGYFVVATIFASACVAAEQAMERLIEPRPVEHLVALALAGLAGFVGNEVAAQVRLRAGRRLESPALVADGHHARTDGLVSLSVVLSAIVVALGLDVADPVIGLIIAVVILRIRSPGRRFARCARASPRAMSCTSPIDDPHQLILHVVGDALRWAAMLDALVWGAASGLIARYLLPRETAGPVATFLCGLGGCLLGFAVGHELLGVHELHLFKPESLIPAITASATLLALSRPIRGTARRDAIFR